MIKEKFRYPPKYTRPKMCTPKKVKNRNVSRTFVKENIIKKKFKYPLKSTRQGKNIGQRVKMSSQ